MAGVSGGVSAAGSIQGGVAEVAGGGAAWRAARSVCGRIAWGDLTVRTVLQSSGCCGETGSEGGGMSWIVSVLSGGYRHYGLPDGDWQNTMKDIANDCDHYSVHMQNALMALAEEVVAAGGDLGDVQSSVVRARSRKRQLAYFRARRCGVPSFCCRLSCRNCRRVMVEPISLTASSDMPVPPRLQMAFAKRHGCRRILQSHHMERGTAGP